MNEDEAPEPRKYEEASFPEAWFHRPVPGLTLILVPTALGAAWMLSVLVAGAAAPEEALADWVFLPLFLVAGLIGGLVRFLFLQETVRGFVAGVFWGLIGAILGLVGLLLAARQVLPGA